jgi:hypothetical protein
LNFWSQKNTNRKKSNIFQQSRMTDREKSNKVISYAALLPEFSCKLILEVWGSGGAIWGFSEAIGLRTPLTIYLWRPTAILVSMVFFIRWLLQLCNRASEIRKDNSRRYMDEISGEIDGLTLQDSTYT